MNSDGRCPAEIKSTGARTVTPYAAGGVVPMMRVGGLVTRALLICGASAFAALLVLISRDVVTAGETWIVWVAIAQTVCTSAEPFHALMEAWRRPGRLRL